MKDRKFYYLPSFTGWLNINNVDCIDLKSCSIYLTCGKVIHNVPVDELNYIMEQEQRQYYEK